jgi:hypothetical protein
MAFSSITLLLPALLALETAESPNGGETATDDTMQPITSPFEIRVQLGVGLQSQEKDTDPFVSSPGLALGYVIFQNLELGASAYSMRRGFVAGPFLRVMSTEPWGPSAEVFSTYGHATNPDSGLSRPAFGFGGNFGLHKPLTKKASTWLGLSILRPHAYGSGANGVTYVLLAFACSIWP